MMTPAIRAVAVACAIGAASAACNSGDGGGGAAAGPDAAPVAVPADAAAAPHAAVVVQHVAGDEATGATHSLPIAATAAGDLLIVAVSIEGTGPGVTAITTSSSQALYRDWFEPIRCGRDLEVWTLGQVDAGVTSVDVTLRAPATSAVTVLEVSGLSRFPLDSLANLGGPASLPPSDITLPGTPGELVLSSATTCGDTLSLDPASPMTSLGVHLGSGLAYQIAGAPGTYGAHWSLGSGDWFQATLAYR
jgi:hypothetical protein